MISMLTKWGSFSEKEIKLFQHLFGLLPAIPRAITDGGLNPVNMYEEMVILLFLNNIPESNATRSIRRCLLALRTGTAWRNSKEFDDLIQL